MRRLFPVAVLIIGCGGASDATKAKSAGDDGTDKDFSQYAATHGITTLEGGGATPEVTADGLRLESLDKSKPVKLDGVLNEWPALTKAMVTAKGATKAGLKISLQYDDAKLYIGADVTDPSFQPGKDHVELVFAVPSPGGTYTTYDLGFYAGKPGETSGNVRYGTRGSVGGAKIVEAPEANGYSFEAAVPWSAVPELKTTREICCGSALACATTRLSRPRERMRTL